MSSSELENGWLLVEKDTKQSLAKIEPPRPQVPQGITRKELIVVHLTASSVAGCGMHFEQELTRSVSSMNPEFQSLFQFLNPSDSRRGFYDEVTLVYVSTRSLPPYSDYTSGRVSTATVLEVFFNGVRLYLDSEEEQEGETMDFPYLLEDGFVGWPSKPVYCQHPTSPDPPYQLCSVNYMEFFEGGDCDDEPVPMRIGLGESALDPQDRGRASLLSKMIQSTVQIWTNMWELGQTLINPVKGV